MTGIGSLTNLGVGFDSLSQALQHPRSAFALPPSSWPDYVGMPDAFMAPLDEAAEDQLKPFQTISNDRATAMALAVASQAWGHADLLALEQPERAGVYWGVGMGGLHTTEATYQRLIVEQAALRPTTVVRIMANAAAASIAMKYGLQGANQTYSVACASSAMALGEAMWAIRAGRLDMAIVGGSESMLVPGVITAWGALKVLATKGNTPHHDTPCRPFSAERSGLVIGEGAAAFVLESKAHAIRRGARPLAQIVGYASTCDAMSLAQPAQHGQVRAMRGALLDAQLKPADIHSINAHATATDAGDWVEAAAFSEVFGTQLIPPVAATKSMHGHLLGAAGAIEAAMSVASLQAQLTPATLGCDPLDHRCSYVNVSAKPRASQIDTVLSNSFAFGGSNASLIFKSVKV